MTKQFPDTDFTHWTEGFNILQSITKNLGKTRKNNVKSYAQWTTWNTKNGYLVSDVRKLIDKVEVLWKEEHCQDKYVIARARFTEWIGSRCAGTLPVQIGTKKHHRHGQEVVMIDFFASMRAFCDNQEKEYPTKKPQQSDLPLQMTNADYVPRCQYDQLRSEFKAFRTQVNARLERMEFKLTDNRDFNINQFKADTRP
mgnify:CR=1 FL=1|tara:strand:- start:370 stop:963 length:594 start_codon:yes stop_codon:yes gene_type:complete